MNSFEGFSKSNSRSNQLRLLSVVLCLGVSMMLGGCGQQQKPGALDAVKRGEYLVKIGGCNDCHTPLKMGANGPQPDMTRMLSGHPEELKLPSPPKLPAGPWVWLGAGTNTAFAGPWGITYSPNLTPDQNTGIGIWTEDKFVRAIRLGKHMGQSR